MNKKQIASASIVGAILASVIYIEGEYTNDPYDPGGETKYGITQRVAREYGYTGSMEALTEEEAYRIYLSLYVNQPNFSSFIDISPAVAHKLIDAGVNVGTARVSIWLQRALNILSRNGNDYPLISEDGVIGNNTIKAYRALESIRGKEKACALVIKSLDSQQASYYSSLTRHSRYIVGWMDKRVGNIPLDQCSEYNLVLPLNAEINNESK